MKILLLTQLFQPEPNHLKGLAFAKELQRLGFEVEVLTGFPNYPGGKIYDGYRIRPWQREEMEGVRIVRLPHIPSHSQSGVMRAANYGTFALSASILGPFLVQRPDVVYVYQGPATLMIPAAVFASSFSARVLLDVQDLWPESVASSGMLRSKLLLKVLKGYCDLAARWADTVVVLSPGYRKRLVASGVEADRIHEVFNWCDESLLEVGDSTEEERAALGLDGSFNIIYAGSMGPVQCLGAVLEAASIVQKCNPHVRFILVGDGVTLSDLQRQAEDLSLTNVRFVGRLPPHEIPHYLAGADALLIHLRHDELGATGIPQKTQAALAAGKPIVMAVRGDAADLVRAAGAGLLCEPEDPQSIARACLEIAALPGFQRASMGQSGRAFYKRLLAFKVGCARVAKILSGT